MRKIRILHVVEALGVGGGVETGIANLIAHMNPERFEHVLCAVFRVGPAIERFPVRIVALNQKRARFSTQAGAIRRAIKQLQPDIVHSRNWGAMEAVLAAKCPRLCPVIHSEHGFETDPAHEPIRRRVFRRVAIAMADHVFCVSATARDMLARATRVPARKIGVIRNGVNMQRFAPNATAGIELRRELGLTPDDFCIGCVGRLSKIKDYPTILRALALLSEAKLMIAGDGVERASLMALATELQIGGRVRFLGDFTRVPEFLNAIDVYALPSICEGISNSLLEAMATGRPVVATAAGGNVEVVVDGESGYLVPVGEAAVLAERLRELMMDAGLRERLGRNAEERVRREFSIPAMISRYEDLYVSLAAPAESCKESWQLEEVSR